LPVDFDALYVNTFSKLFNEMLMRKRDFDAGVAFMLITSLVMGGAIGEALHARSARGDLTAGAAPVILEVMATDKRAHAPAEGLTQDDFEIIEDRGVAHISSFAHGSEGSLRPLSLWFVLQCPEEHSYFNWVSNGSGFMKGKTATLTPVLKKLNERDTVGVAHWCDNGEFGIDLLPSTDRVAPQNVLDAVLNATRTDIGGTPGENALHDLVIRVRDTARRLTPKAQPVMIFLYGDRSGMHHDQVEDMLDQPLGPLPIVYAINNGAVSIQRLPVTDKYTQMFVAHFLADRTGGRVLSSVRGNYAGDLEQILAELYGRYEIGFVPSATIGKHYELKVKLSEEARKKIKSVEFSFPPKLVAAAPDQEAAEIEMAATLVQAIKSGSAYTEIAFDASGSYQNRGLTAQFRVYIDPHSLSWKAMEDGGRKATVSVIVGGESTDNKVIDYQAKEFEALQTKVEQAGAARKAVILSIDYEVPAEAVRIRVVTRDAASGRLGSFELPVNRIHGVAKSRPAVQSEPKTPSL
jgi:hypothetical protein